MRLLSFQGECPLMPGSVPLTAGSGRHNGKTTTASPLLFSKKQSKGEREQGKHCNTKVTAENKKGERFMSESPQMY